MSELLVMLTLEDIRFCLVALDKMAIAGNIRLGDITGMAQVANKLLKHIPKEEKEPPKPLDIPVPVAKESN